MSQSPTGAVPENTFVTFTCVTDEASPTADVVWTVSGSDSISQSRNSIMYGLYRAQKRRSVLRVRVNRALNGQRVECHVSGKVKVTDRVTLDVRCELSKNYICYFTIFRIFAQQLYLQSLLYITIV